MTIPLFIDEQDVYTVSRLNQRVRSCLEEQFSLVWLEGEVSNLARPASGHLYFSLKDAKAQVRCALFRNRAALLRIQPENGQQVRVSARVSLYEPRGDFQLLVETLTDAGDGALRRAFEALRLQLEQEGLFAVAHKKPLPRFPRRIGVITSPTGAAIRDVLSVLQRRFPALPVLLYPVLVQGEEAAPRIAQTLRLASVRHDCDVLLLVRGGGSLEDLWAFNEEEVARAIYDCAIPVVCGVGHESDVTIADFTADLRAPTPSAAAELVSPDRIEWLGKFILSQERLYDALYRRLEGLRQTLAWRDQRLLHLHPGRRLQDRSQRLDELEQRLWHAMRLRLERLDTRTNALTDRLTTQTPQPRLQRLLEQQRSLRERLETAMERRLEHHADRLAHLAQVLQTVSPLQTLGRGYAIVRRHPEGTLIRQARELQQDDQVDVTLGKGRLVCQVKEIHD